MITPDFIVDRVILSTLLIDKTIDVKRAFPILCDSVRSYLDSMETGFVSNNSKEFKDFLEEKVGRVEFSKPFAVRIRPDSVRLFIKGKEVFK